MIRSRPWIAIERAPIDPDDGKVIDIGASLRDDPLGERWRGKTGSVTPRDRDWIDAAIYAAMMIVPVCAIIVGLLAALP